MEQFPNGVPDKWLTSLSSDKEDTEKKHKKEEVFQTALSQRFIPYGFEKPSQDVEPSLKKIGFVTDNYRIWNGLYHLEVPEDSHLKTIFAFIGREYKEGTTVFYGDVPIIKIGHKRETYPHPGQSDFYIHAEYCIVISEKIADIENLSKETGPAYQQALKYAEQINKAQTHQLVFGLGQPNPNQFLESLFVTNVYFPVYLEDNHISDSSITLLKKLGFDPLTKRCHDLGDESAQTVAICLPIPENRHLTRKISFSDHCRQIVIMATPSISESAAKLALTDPKSTQVAKPTSKFTERKATRITYALYCEGVKTPLMTTEVVILSMPNGKHQYQSLSFIINDTAVQEALSLYPEPTSIRPEVQTLCDQLTQNTLKTLDLSAYVKQDCDKKDVLALSHKEIFLLESALEKHARSVGSQGPSLTSVNLAKTGLVASNRKILGSIRTLLLRNVLVALNISGEHFEISPTTTHQDFLKNLAKNTSLRSLNCHDTYIDNKPFFAVFSLKSMQAGLETLVVGVEKRMTAPSLRNPSHEIVHSLPLQMMEDAGKMKSLRTLEIVGFWFSVQGSPGSTIMNCLIAILPTLAVHKLVLKGYCEPLYERESRSCLSMLAGNPFIKDLTLRGLPLIDFHKDLSEFGDYRSYLDTFKSFFESNVTIEKFSYEDPEAESGCHAAKVKEFQGKLQDMLNSQTRLEKRQKMQAEKSGDGKPLLLSQPFAQLSDKEREALARANTVTFEP